MKSNNQYVIGVDYGTLTCRAVLVNVNNGKVVSTATKDYSHGVMDKFMPDGVSPLPPDWALQHPQDYLDCLAYVIPEVLRIANVDAEDVVGIGTDATECTMIPIKKDGTPLCFIDEFKDNKHAYVKLWKHHSPQKYADKIAEIAKKRNEPFLKQYGDIVSSEWMFPKIMETLEEAPEVYNACDMFIELADWITLLLTGKEKRNSCTAGYKALWQKGIGYPSNDFWKDVDDRMENVVDEKLSKDIYALGTKAGTITQSAAKLTTLKEGTSVAVAAGDGHVAFFGAGVTKPDTLLIVFGTSGVSELVTKNRTAIPGICGNCEDGILPNHFGLEAGQCCLGDHFKWFSKKCVSYDLHKKAKKKGIPILEYLDQEASKIKPGESGLVALDWWNGNRSILGNSNLSGCLVGMTLTTSSIEIYKALVEAVAYGERVIIENFVNHGANVNEIVATGGIAEKSAFVMQTYADVLNKEIKVVDVQNATAMGSAILGAVASGHYKSIEKATEAFKPGIRSVYTPKPQNVSLYNELFKQYFKMHEFFGRETNVMKDLKNLRRKCSK
ncbi:L-ribulokinase [Tritrichomonas foetus]|uniref:glycerol kinase n=1 Tax=Tritrichomonas foetus TaxID=1144522 RepID=A0A1J4L3J2_9EUKA|nr:L-ribulokinase [Tritrichomonas foetus]|eukprot:OHT16518.1 L-ribulokinase [Tritrichomonas foetus]